MSPRSQEKAKRVGIWLRVSTEDQVRGESPETHERRARLYAEAKGWTVIGVYRLDAVSGKTVKEHPEAKRMLVDIRDGHITGLIFSKLARLARNIPSRPPLLHHDRCDGPMGAGRDRRASCSISSGARTTREALGWRCPHTDTSGRPNNW